MKRFIQELSRDEQRLGVKVAASTWALMTLLYWLTGVTPFAVSIAAGAATAVALLYALTLGYQALRSVDTRLSILSTIAISTAMLAGHWALTLSSGSSLTEIRPVANEQLPISDSRTRVTKSWNAAQEAQEQRDTRSLWLAICGLLAYGSIRLPCSLNSNEEYSVRAT